MRFDLDKYVKLHEQGVYIRARRTEMIASNLANADTPNYKSKDFDFRALLKQVADSDSASNLRMTNPKHIQPGGRSAADAEASGFDVAVDANGRIIVLDTIENTVRVFVRKEKG